MNDEEVIQPNPTDPIADPMDDTGADNDSPSSPRIFDFSSDFNISPIKDDPATAFSPPKTTSPVKAPVSIPVAPKPPINKLESLPPEPPKKAEPASPPVEPPAEPVKQTYREPVETGASWPFAFAKTNPEQVSMAPAAAPGTPATPPVTPPAPPKTAPSASPVKTIQTGYKRDEEKSLVGGSLTDLQRDVSAIMPNLNPKGSDAVTPTAPIIPQTSSQGTESRSFPFAERPTLDLKNLRTYESDVADVLAHRKTSTASIAIAENKRQGGGERLANIEEPSAPMPSRDEAAPKTSSGTGRKILYILVSLILIGAGGIGGYYLYRQSSLFLAQQPAPPVSNPSDSMIHSDSKAVILTDNLDAAGIRAKVEAEMSKSQSPNTIKELIMVKTFDEILARVGPADMAKTMKLPVPDILARTLTSSWMVGVYADPSGVESPFVAVRSDLFQNAFSGMLEWEKTLPNDITPYLRSANPNPRGQFRNEIIKNKDVRSYVDENGQTLFVYSFLDNWTLVIAENGTVLSEIITRLENQVFVR